MVNVKLLLCLVLVVSAVNIIECKGRKRFGKHKSHGSHNRRSGGWFFGWGKSKSSSSHSYPSSSGYSGHGSGGSHSYPASHGYSGSGSRSWGASRHVPSVPTYYTSPQHVYVTQYRKSESRYGDLLTGLTMYNLGRSHGHYHHHYYNDDYYKTSVKHRETESNTANTVGVAPKDEATCFLRIKKKKQEDILKIPCAIVSTFGNGTLKTLDAVSNITSNNCSSVLNMTLDNKLPDKKTNLNTDVMVNVNETSSDITLNCGNTTIDVKDPLAVKGAPVDVKNMECSVEIRTKVEELNKLKVIRNNVDCVVLLQHAKMPVPENKNSDILPARHELKAMLEKPPWWLSLFIAV